MLYGIAGSGDVNHKIVIEGLADVVSAHENITFLIHARRNPQGAVTSVYDFLADNECDFMAYHRVDDNAPKALLNLALEAYVTDDPLVDIINALKEDNGTLLLLWDESNNESSEKIAIMAADAGIPIKDLSNGLAPIVVEGSEEPEIAPETQTETSKDETVTLTPFTRDELMNMNYGVLRRQAKSQGFETIPNTKEGIVALLLGEEHVNEETPSVLHPLLVWYKDGQLVSKTVNYEEVKHLLG